MSLQVVNNIILDCSKLQKLDPIIVKQGDNLTRIIRITINNNNELLDLNNLKLKYVISKPDGKQILKDIEFKNNPVEITLSSNELACAGICDCEIILCEEKHILTTIPFKLKVIPSVIDEDKIESSDEYESLINILFNAEDILQKISELEKEASKNEEERKANELERTSYFNTFKENSDTALEELKINSQEAKTNAQSAKENGDYAKNQADRIENSDMSSVINDIENIQAYIGYVDEDIYGVEVDFSTNCFKRLSASIDLQPGSNFDNIAPFNRRRCIVKDDGTIVAYYGDENYTETGKLSTGESVQVMVEQPKFYYKVVPLKLEKNSQEESYHLKKARYYISPTYKKGFKLHPAFVVDGKELDKIYISAFEASIYDISGNTYLINDEQDIDFSTDKLSSISNVLPCSGSNKELNMSNARKLANNRGSGWSISNIYTVSATQMLFLIEYASFNMQEKLGKGIVGVESSIKTGETSSLGNISTDQSCKSSTSYRGEENFYGNIWSFVDFINIEAKGKNTVSIANNVLTNEQYSPTNLILCKENGYISSFAYDKDFDFLFLPSECKGNNVFPVGDYLYQNYNYDGVTILRCGGTFNTYNVNAGAFCYDTYTTINGKTVTTGARLIYTK